MKFYPGQKVRTKDKNCSIGNWIGTVLSIVTNDSQQREEVYCNWYEGNVIKSSNTWMRADELRFASKFCEGDVIEIDGEQLVVDLEIPFNEDDAKLISRKQLI